MKLTLLVCSLFLIALSSKSQDFRWQQRVEYAMDVKLNTETHRIDGTQELVYYNNSPDTLSKVYYHLYFNAFQPGSMMDMRSRTIDDPDPRVKDRIFKLEEDERGYQHVLSLKQDGKSISYKVDGTILEVTLAKALLPKTKSTFDLTFEAQVPIQIRRSGRNNREGIAYTMTQWYPKMAEYDFQGWHAYQYVAREFHSVWGDFDVKISIDPKFVVASTGKLQNPNEIGHGYEKTGTALKRPSGNLAWHFIAKDVIDFAWAADAEYTHDKQQVPDGPELHFFYQKNEKTSVTWKIMEDVAVKVFQHLNKNFGKYPFDTYSVNSETLPAMWKRTPVQTMDLDGRGVSEMSLPLRTGSRFLPRRNGREHRADRSVDHRGDCDWIWRHPSRSSSRETGGVCGIGRILHAVPCLSLHEDHLECGRHDHARHDG